MMEKKLSYSSAAAIGNKLTRHDGEIIKSNDNNVNIIQHEHYHRCQVADEDYRI